MSVKSDRAFPRTARLRTPVEFREAFAKGRRLRGRMVNLLHGPLAQGEKQPVSRWAVVVGRKFGTAVKRNRAKRVAREVIRQERANFPRGRFYVVEVMAAAREIDAKTLGQAVYELLQKASQTL